MEVILLNSHYMYAILPMLCNLKVVVNGDLSIAKILMDIMPSIMAFVSTTYNFDGEHAIWKGMPTHRSFQL
jgi:hypothetical protein